MGLVSVSLDQCGPLSPQKWGSNRFSSEHFSVARSMLVPKSLWLGQMSLSAQQFPDLGSVVPG